MASSKRCQVFRLRTTIREELFAPEPISSDMPSSSADPILSLTNDSEPIEWSCDDSMDCPDGQPNPSCVESPLFNLTDVSDNDTILSDNECNVVESPDLLTKLNSWYMAHNAHSLSSYSQLLKVLHPIHPELPLCAKTALKTNIEADTIDMDNFRGEKGKFVYMGFVNRVISIAQKNPVFMAELKKLKEIKVVLSTDGVSLFNNSAEKTGSWPIAALIISPRYYIPPIIFALFVGPSKPGDQFLKQFSHEMSAIACNEIGFGGKLSLPFIILGFSADSPARCLLKRIVSSGACSGCERCRSLGKKIDGTLCFPTFIKGILRNHADFVLQADPSHHHGPSEFSNIRNIDMIRQFFLDPLHLCDEGAGKRLINKYFTDKFSDLLLSQSQMDQITVDLFAAKACLSTDFERAIVAVQKLAQWKGVTFRNFFCYFGIVIMKKYLQPASYIHLLKFCCAMRILRNRKQCVLESEINKADQLLKEFVNEYDEHVGYNDTVFSIHSLLHICDDVRYTNLPLDDFSCYAFENAWGALKKLLKSPTKPAAQLARRLRERESHFKLYKKFYELVECTYNRAGKIIEIHYKYLRIVPNSKGDGFVMSKTCHRVYKVTQIIQKGNSNYELLCLEYSVIGSFFNQPMDSAEFGIFEVRPKNSPLVKIDLKSVLCKLYLVPYKERFVVLPVLHSL